MRFLIAVATAVARGIYALIKAVAPQRRKVVFLSRQSDRPSRDFTLLADELRRRDASLEIVTRCRKLGEGPYARLMSAFAMLGQLYHLATARVCIVDGHVIPVSLLDHRRDLYVIQMWHALGAIKKFGYQTVGRPGGRSAEIATALRMHRNYDLVLCGGPATVPAFAEAFDVDPARVAPLGLPRIDYLKQHAGDARTVPEPPAVAELRRRFPLLADPARTKVLYAPTFRADRAPDYAAVIDAFSAGRFVVMVKPHPLETADVRGENVVDVSGCDVLDLLPVCDVVVTDYSAVAFEALVLDLPLYFYVPDIEEYRHENGLNIDPLTAVPQIASRDIGDIAGWIASGDPGQAARARLRDDYLSTSAGGCTDMIADVVFDHLAAGVR